MTNLSQVILPNGNSAQTGLFLSFDVMQSIPM